MKKFILAALILITIPASAQEQGVLKDGLVFTNPPNGSILVDTGALDTAAQWAGGVCDTGGWYLVNVHVSSTVGGFFEVRYKDAGGAVTHSVYRGVGVNDSKDFMPRIAIQIPENGKVQVLTTTLPSVFVGLAQATVTYAFTGCY